MTRPRQNPGEAGFEPGTFRSRGGPKEDRQIQIPKEDRQVQSHMKDKDIKTNTTKENSGTKTFRRWREKIPKEDRTKRPSEERQANKHTENKQRDKKKKIYRKQTDKTTFRRHIKTNRKEAQLADSTAVLKYT